MNIFIDDDRICPKGYIPIKTSIGAKNYLINHHKIDIVTFDHDMGSNQLSCYELIKLLVNNYDVFNNIHEVRFHTNNFIGGQNMYYFLKNAQKCEIINQNLIINKYVYQYNAKKLYKTSKTWI